MQRVMTCFLLGVFVYLQDAATQSVPSACLIDVTLVMCDSGQRAYVSLPMPTTGGTYVLGVDVPRRHVEWRATVSDRVDSFLVATSSVVAFACNKGDICALSRTTGEEVWRVRERARDHTVVDNIVVAQTALEGAIGIDDRSGTIIWRHRGERLRTTSLLHFFDVSGSLVLTDVLTLDGRTGAVVTRFPSRGGEAVTAGTFAGDLQVLAHQTRLKAYFRDGRQAWESGLPVEGFQLPTVMALRGFDQGVIAVVAESKVGPGVFRIARLSSTGALLWTQDIREIAWTGIWPRGSISIVAERVVVITLNPDLRSSIIRSFELQRGTPGWSVRVPATFGSDRLLTTDRSYLIGSEGGRQILMAIDVGNGRVESLMNFSE